MKRIKRQRSCPQCGTKVGWTRWALKSTITARWNCSGCGALLEFDWQRRVAVALAGGLSTGVLVIGVRELQWWVIPVGVALFGYVWSYDSVRLAGEKRPALGAPDEKGV